MLHSISITKKVMYGILALLSFTVFSEIVLRLSGFDSYVQNRVFVVNRALDYPDVFLRDSKLFWKLKRNQIVSSKFFLGRTFHINSLGLRGSEISITKTKPRVIALGNSCTFGWGIDSNFIYTSELKHIFGSQYEIINAGIPGYSSFQGKLFFDKELLKLKPDYVLILFGWNDHWAAANEIADKNQRQPSELITNLQNCLNKLQLYRAIKKTILSSFDSNVDSLFDRDNPVYRVELRDFENNLRSICRSARKNRAIPVLITAPIPSLENYYPPGSSSGLHKYHEFYNQTVRRIAIQDSVLLVDAALEFDKYSDLYDDAEKDPIHFNSKGHQILAQLIAAQIFSGN